MTIQMTIWLNIIHLPYSHFIPENKNNNNKGRGLELPNSIFAHCHLPKLSCIIVSIKLFYLKIFYFCNSSEFKCTNK